MDLLIAPASAGPRSWKDRAQLSRLLDQLEADDVLMVTRLDRLARSTSDLLNTLAAMTAKKAGFRSLGDAWADTTTAHGRLTLTVLGGLAEFERDLIRARTGEGRARAALTCWPNVCAFFAISIRPMKLSISAKAFNA
jgi:DNA invertase Pin-like site-specific DNA recombinase